MFKACNMKCFNKEDVSVQNIFGHSVYHKFLFAIQWFSVLNFKIYLGCWKCLNVYVAGYFKINMNITNKLSFIGLTGLYLLQMPGIFIISKNTTNVINFPNTNWLVVGLQEKCDCNLSSILYYFSVHVSRSMQIFY